MLEWGECGEVRDPDSSTLLWRGLLAKVGIAYGVPASKAPLNTGGWGVGAASFAGQLRQMQHWLASAETARVPARPASIPGIQPSVFSFLQACSSACMSTVRLPAPAMQGVLTTLARCPTWPPA